MANDPINLYDFEARAALALPHDNWDFIDAGAMDELTTKHVSYKHLKMTTKA